MAGAAVRLRQKRVASGVSLRSLAERMNVSPMYLSDLERAKRNWSSVLIGRFLDALAEMKGTNDKTE